MDLEQLGRRRRVGDAGGVEDEQHGVGVAIELRPLAELARVLERERVQVQSASPSAVEVVVGGPVQVEPEELVALDELARWPPAPRA